MADDDREAGASTASTLHPIGIVLLLLARVLSVAQARVPPYRRDQRPAIRDAELRIRVNGSAATAVASSELIVVAMGLPPHRNLVERPQRFFNASWILATAASISPGRPRDGEGAFSLTAPPAPSATGRGCRGGSRPICLCHTTGFTARTRIRCVQIVRCAPHVFERFVALVVVVMIGPMEVRDDLVQGLDNPLLLRGVFVLLLRLPSCGV